MKKRLSVEGPDIYTLQLKKMVVSVEALLYNNNVRRKNGIHLGTTK